MPETQYVGMGDKILIVAHSLCRSCLPARKRSITKNTMSRPAKILIVWFKSTTGTVPPIINGPGTLFPVGLSVCPGGLGSHSGIEAQRSSCNAESLVYPSFCRFVGGHGFLRGHFEGIFSTFGSLGGFWREPKRRGNSGASPGQYQLL